MRYVHERDCVLCHQHAPVCKCGWPDAPCQLQVEHQKDVDEYREDMSIGGLPYRGDR